MIAIFLATALGTFVAVLGVHYTHRWLRRQRRKESK